MNLDEIELKYNFDFELEIKNKYSSMIIDIFNNNCSEKYYNNMDSDMMIIIALHNIYNKKYDMAIDILLEAINRNNLRASNTLGILYNILNNKEESIKYFKYGADKGHILSSTNLAFEYLCQGEFNLFLEHNQIGLKYNDENALINNAIYLWNVLKNYNIAIDIFNKLINNNRACYEYAKLINFDDKKKELLINAIKLKPKICYINMLKKITNDFERYELYKKNNINMELLKDYDKFEFNTYIINKCPICYKLEKMELFTLKCNHSLCIECLKKYCKNKCYLC